MIPPPVAAIDCGTNSTRLLVAGPDGAGGLRTVSRLMHITRLGEAVDRTHLLDPTAIERTQAVLAEYREVMDAHGVPAGQVRMAATSAARDATNRDEWFDAAERVVGARPELLSGALEADLSFRGATSGLEAARGPFLVFDLGGGSTEVAYGTDSVEASVSLEVGCVRLTERFIASDPPRPEELTAAISYAQAWFDDVLRTMPGAASAPAVLGLAGTVSTVAAVEIGLATYDRDRIHHFVLTKDAAEDVFRTLATESRADRLANPGLEEARADVIVGGCCALVALYRTLGLDEVLVSEADILDGLALSLLDGL
ncbi:Ppx/GppA phosphatase family protein [Iamia sp.]|uniref:Ppx/GppA phosphatase family protein n=1 Tax=Iamia sp. TaxID=2722710 RepID=UPI002B7627DB|nr:Ppx/GppA phosphatase family protein [Iamia sp.]HXH59470.1 Ppx/GppA phosphatase family protein [Iamia sp.]